LSRAASSTVCKGVTHLKILTVSSIHSLSGQLLARSPLSIKVVTAIQGPTVTVARADSSYDKGSTVAVQKTKLEEMEALDTPWKPTIKTPHIQY
jgi:hypothetical protein